MARRGLAAGAGAVSRVRFAPCSNNLIVSSWDSGLRLYDTNASTLRLEANSEAALLDCCFKDEFVAFAGDSVGSIVRYDLHSGAQDTVGLHDDAVVSTEFSQTTGYAAGSMDGTVALKYFDHEVDNDMGYTFRCHPRSGDGTSSLVPINSISVHPSKETFVTGDNEGYAIVWNALSKKKLLELPSYSGSVVSMAYNHCGQLLAVASNYTHQGADRVVEVEGHQIYIETMRNSGGKSTKTGPADILYNQLN